ncbi:MAG: DUF624 domain-containing protein [Anaerolineaceae bacterium]|nr:DUF624 domain-containing protein [Anaerolineaceae bacterium]
MIKTILSIIRDTFRDVWSDLWTMLVVNFFWLLANLLIVPGPPATLALFYFTNHVAHGEVTDLADFWRYFRQNWGIAWRWGVVNTGVIVFLVVDIVLTAQFEGSWTSFLQVFYIVCLVVWLALQLFSLPFLFEQETMNIRQSRRNARILIGGNPGFTVMLLIGLILILVLFTVAFMLSLMFGMVFLACAGNRAVLNRLEFSRASTPDMGDGQRISG